MNPIIPENKKLTSTEQRVLNNLSMQQNRRVKLGDLVSFVLGTIELGTPTNATLGTATLEVNGTVAHGETITVGPDVFEFTARENKAVAEGNIPIDIMLATTPASNDLTVAAQPTSGDKMTIGEKVYTFVPVGTDTADGEISIGTNLTEAQEAIVAAINGTDEFNIAHPDVFISNFDTNDKAKVTCLFGGTPGHAIVTTATLTAPGNEFDEATLLGGTDCLVATALDLIIDAINEEGTVKVLAEQVDQEDEILLSKLGLQANAIVVETTGANLVFTGGADSLEGGLDGTVSEATKVMVDDDYVYISVGANSQTDANWRKIELLSLRE